MCGNRPAGKRLFIFGMIAILAAAGCGGVDGTDGNRNGNESGAGNEAGGENHAVSG